MCRLYRSVCARLLQVMQVLLQQLYKLSQLLQLLGLWHVESHKLSDKLLIMCLTALRFMISNKVGKPQKWY